MNSDPISPALTIPPDVSDERGLLAVDTTRQTLVQLVEECAQALLDLAPAFHLRRAFFDGAWVVGVHAGGQRSDVPSFSRLDVELSLRDDGTRVDLVTRSTVRNRDESSVELLDVPVEASAVRHFVEHAFLSFTERYFDRS